MQDLTGLTFLVKLPEKITFGARSPGTEQWRCRKRGVAIGHVAPTGNKFDFPGDGMTGISTL